MQVNSQCNGRGRCGGGGGSVLFGNPVCLPGNSGVDERMELCGARADVNTTHPGETLFSSHQTFYFILVFSCTVLETDQGLNKTSKEIPMCSPVRKTGKREKIFFFLV